MQFSTPHGRMTGTLTASDNYLFRSMTCDIKVHVHLCRVQSTFFLVLPSQGSWLLHSSRRVACPVMDPGGLSP